MKNANEATRQRLNSLTTPHATAWLSSAPLLKIISQGEFVAGLKWVAGQKIRDHAYVCPDCGREADPYGLHAVTCQRSGSISRGHTTLRDTVAELLGMAGITTASEQKLPDGPERPADLLVSSWRSRTVAIDFTIITPTRASSSATSSTSTTTLMDQAAALKEQKSQGACAAAVLGLPAVRGRYVRRLARRRA